MDFGKGVSPGATDDDGVAFFGPFEHRPRSHAEFAANGRWNGDLTLGGDLRSRQRHETHITTVMWPRSDPRTLAPSHNAGV